MVHLCGILAKTRHRHFINSSLNCCAVKTQAQHTNTIILYQMSSMGKERWRWRWWRRRRGSFGLVVHLQEVGALRYWPQLCASNSWAKYEVISWHERLVEGQRPSFVNMSGTDMCRTNILAFMKMFVVCSCTFHGYGQSTHRFTKISWVTPMNNKTFVPRLNCGTLKELYINECQTIWNWKEGVL